MGLEWMEPCSDGQGRRFDSDGGKTGDHRSPRRLEMASHPRTRHIIDLTSNGLVEGALGLGPRLALDHCHATGERLAPPARSGSRRRRESDPPSSQPEALDALRPEPQRSRWAMNDGRMYPTIHESLGRGRARPHRSNRRHSFLAKETLQDLEPGLAAHDNETRPTRFKDSQASLLDDAVGDAPPLRADPYWGGNGSVSDPAGAHQGAVSWCLASDGVNRCRIDAKQRLNVDAQCSRQCECCVDARKVATLFHRTNELTANPRLRSELGLRQPGTLAERP